MGNLIYNLNVSIWKYGEWSIHMDNMINKISYNLNEAIEIGVEFIKERIIILSDDENVNIKQYILDNNLKYNFDIQVIFPTMTNQYKEKEFIDILKTTPKKFKYDVMIGRCQFEYLSYSYDGRLLTSQMGLDEYDLTCNTKAFDEDKYHYNKFHKGDIVKLKDSDTQFRIYACDRINESIYEVEDPLHFNKGYFIETLNGDPINDYGACALCDEDLILVERNL